MQKPATVEALTPAGPPRQLALCGPDAEEEDGEPGQEDDDGVQAYSGHHELEHEDGLAHDVDDGLEDEDAALDGHGGEISEPGESHSEDELPPISQRPAQRQQALLDDGMDDDLDMENLAPPRALQRPAQRAVAATPPAQRRGAGVSHDIMPPCMKKRVLGGSAAARRQHAGSKQRASNAAVASKTPLQGGQVRMYANRKGAGGGQKRPRPASGRQRQLATGPSKVQALRSRTNVPLPTAE